LSWVETSGFGRAGTADENNSFSYRSGIAEVTYCFGVFRPKVWLKFLFSAGKR
jgi:hypothetical protein